MNQKDLAIQNATNRAFGKTNSAYPGQNAGMTLDQVKELVANAIKFTGISFSSAAGNVTPNVQIPNTAKFIKGICFAGAPAAGDTFDLLINEEKIVATGAVSAFTQSSGKPLEGFFPIFRPVSSSTAVSLIYTSTAANAIICQIAYI